MKDFFYKYWILFYVLFFILLGILIYALFWQPNYDGFTNKINELNKQLIDCRNNKTVIDSISNEVENPSEKEEIIDCNETVQSGGQGTTENNHDLGTKPGKVIVEFDMNTIPDEMIIYLDDKEIANTNGLVSGGGYLKFNFDPNKSKFCKIIVKAPQTNTEWKYLVNCPK